jgi:hypothetical protein
LALPGGGPGPAFVFPEPNRLANGVTLVGYDRPVEVEGGVRWQVHWETGAAGEADYHFFNHLMDGDGRRVGQADAAAYPARQWRTGDRVVSRYTVSRPGEAAGPLWMRTGMYTYPAVENVPVLDVAGNPCADAVEARLP